MSLRTILPCVATIYFGFKIYSYYKSSRYVSPNRRIVVVTGCDSGIGNWLAEALIKWGFQVVAGVIDINSDNAKRLQSLGVIVVELDVTCEEHIVMLNDVLQELLMDQKKELWCIINNAGVLTYAPCECLTPKMIDRQININLNGAMQVTWGLLPILRKYKGRIINVSSPQALVQSASLAVYCASKNGLEGFSHALRRELDSYGVSVVIVRPGNLPHKTSIMKHNVLQLQEMNNCMRPMTRDLYKDQISSIIDSFKQEYHQIQDNSPDARLMNIFKKAIFSKAPQVEYNASSYLVNWFFWVCCMMPHSAVDFIVRNNIHYLIFK